MNDFIERGRGGAGSGVGRLRLGIGSVEVGLQWRSAIARHRISTYIEFRIIWIDEK